MSGLPVVAQTTFFTDNFANGSTLNGPSVRTGTPTASATSYDVASTKAATLSVIAPNDMRVALNTNTTSGFWETQSIFATNAIALAVDGDYIDVQVVFTNSTGTILAGGTSSLLWLGLYNSAGNLPVAGGLTNSGLSATAGSTFATGNCANWVGYVAQISSGGTTRLTTRPLQNGAGTTSANQELCGNNVGGGAFNNPGATTISTAPTTSISLTTGGVYTEELRFTMTDAAVLSVTNILYVGVGTGGTVLLAQGSTNISSANSEYLTGSFDGLAIGARNSGTSLNPLMDISSITIIGQSSPITTPPTITVQPQPVTVVTTGSCAFSTAAVGSGVTFQWFRNGTALANSGNISGATSSLLVVSPAGAGDVFSGANGYYCKISGTGGFSTNTVTNSLSLIPSTSLVWTAAGGNTWDVNNTASWKNPPSTTALVFNFGDPVTLDDTAPNEIVNLSGPYISPSSVSITTAQAYTIQGSGSLAGPMSLTFNGSGVQGELILSAINTYTGGTIITNGAYVQVNNYGGLGNGPVYLNDEGGTMEFTNSGSASVGVEGTVNVNANYTIQVDATGTFGAVFLGDLAGQVGKTLTFIDKTAGVTNRIRVYGASTTNNANIALNGPSVPNQALFYGMQWAPYLPSGIQLYNGVISGNGGIVQRGNGTSIYAGQNTFSGGTFTTAGNIGIAADSAPALASGPLGTGDLVICPEVGSGNGTGGIFASGGAHTIANPVVYPSNTNNQTLLIGGTNALTLSGTIKLNGADGSTGPIIRTFQVTNTALTTFSGVVSDGSQVCSVTKTGNGVLALTSPESYTGTNTVLAGTLLVNSSLTTLAMNVGTNATLGGSGTISGPVTLTNGATIQPGNQAIGTLTINGTLTMQSSTNYFLVSKTGSLKSVINATTVNYSGTLFATNIAGNSTLTDTYNIYNAGSHTGNFTAVTGSPGPGLAWAFNPTTGVLSVIQGVNPNPTNIVVQVSGNQLTLSWPADHIGWQLQAQTNTLGKGLFTNWVNVPGTTTVGTNVITMDPSVGTVFYRMILP